MELFNSFYAAFLTTQTGLYIAGSILGILIIGFAGAPLILWTLALAAGVFFVLPVDRRP